MLKNQMEYELKVAQERIKLKESEDIQMREHLSKFLDSYETPDQWRDSREVKILSWEEIYFELGKSKGYTSVLRDDSSLRGRVENLQQIVEMLLKEQREKEQREKKS